MRAPIVLIDGSSYFYRAFHALPPLTTSKGLPTGAIYGVANMVKKLIKETQPEHMVVVFDAKGKTFRDEWYPAYKAHRAPTPPDLSIQFEPLITLLKAMGLPLLIIDGVEADDVIGTLALEATKREYPILISTGDKDMAQLVNDHVTLINTMSNQVLDTKGVINKFGVMPSQIIDYLTLVGDTSDNVPGVNKCGPKTAVKWLAEYQTLDNLVAHANDIGGKIGENLRNSLDYLPLSKKLVTIKTDVNLPFGIEDLSLLPENHDELIELAREFEFKGWLKELLTPSNDIDNAPVNPPTKIDYETITTTTQLDNWLTQLNKAPLFAIDTETTSLDALRAELVGLSFSCQPGKAAYIPLMHQESTAQLDKVMVLNALKPLLENPKHLKVGQNLKYDYTIFKNQGITLQGIAFDTMLESYVLNSSQMRHDLDSLSLKYLGHKTITFEEVAGKGAKQLRFDAVPIKTAALYAAEDADITLQLHHALFSQMDAPLKAILETIEVPLLTVLAEMEQTGVLVDCEVLKHQGERLKLRIQALEQEAIQLANRPFNLNSPAQLQTLLFDELKLPIISKTPSGAPSTAEAVLQELSLEYRLPALILEYRSLTKLVSTYIEALPKRVNPMTGRVHTSYNQAIAATGRLSSSEPNLQNIPVRTEEGRLIRTAFIAPKGSVILSADYSQIELRIMAHLSKDEGLLTAFANRWDIHKATASEIFQTPLTEVSNEQRRRAKAVNFGLIYGMSAFGLAKQLNVSRQEAQYYMECYFHRYPKVLAYMETTRQLAHQQGYVETLFGRRLYLPDINTRNMMRQKAAERAAINAPMQGTAADIIKRAMLSIHSWLSSQSAPPARMIMQVHDELVFEVAQNNITEVQQYIKEHMENTTRLDVPLLVSIGTGLNWDEAH